MFFEPSFDKLHDCELNLINLLSPTQCTIFISDSDMQDILFFYFFILFFIFFILLLVFAIHRNSYKTISTQIFKCTNITYNTILRPIIIIIIIIIIMISIVIILFFVIILTIFLYLQC